MCCHVFVSEKMNDTYLFISAQNPSVVSSSLCSIIMPCFCFTLLFTSCHLLCNFSSVFFFFFFCDLEQSTVQLFRELSNPASDLSRAARPNRIVVLTLMTIPPAVAEPPVGHQEECVGGWLAERQRGRWLTERDRHRWTETGSESMWCS